MQAWPWHLRRALCTLRIHLFSSDFPELRCWKGLREPRPLVPRCARMLIFRVAESLQRACDANVV